ncbi:restriction endonuclease subunit S [Methanosarcina sp. T3]|uniref:restriction endonuclease subunit S n=1 Tax=Methanosarcina sp. T3 TaxID=3439062 RepID=UPI003F849267
MSAECRSDNIPPGYKQTEVGVIPEDWKVKPMAELFTFQNGVNADKSSYGSGIPFINVLEVITHSTITEDKIPGKISLSAQAISAFTVQRGDILFNRTSETQEEVGLTSVYIGNEVVVFGGFVIRARPKDSSLYSIFTSYVLRSPAIRSQIMARGQGAVRANIGQQDLSRVLVVLPTKAEQEAIAEALSDADALIESLEQLIAKKRQIKQGAMQELLTGKRRLPGFSGEWETKRLGDIAEIRDGTHQTPKYVECGIPFFSVENVTSGDFTNTKFISENEHRFLTKSFKIEKGDILMTRIGSIGDCKFIDWNVDASFYVSLALLKIRKSYSAEFICHYSKTTAFKKEIELNSLQSAIPKKINLGPISDVLIKLPKSFDEQIAIATILSDMDSEITALEEKLAKARQIKQGMMQELLTGRIRLI